MTRVIEFRGKSKKTGEWLYGDLVRNVDGAFAVVPPFKMTCNNYCEQYEVEEDTIGQNTEMYDIRLKKIYEGDVVTWLSNGFMETGRIEYKQEEAQYRIVNRLPTRDNRERTHTIQNRTHLLVRGNIYDNPSLMEI